MKIGPVELQDNAILAPLAGITNLPFRLMVKSHGCGLVCSEMISSNGLVHGSSKTLDMLTSSSDEKPLSVQIFGSNPQIMADAAQIVESSGADILDINFGCSVKKVVKTGSGVDLMRHPDKAETVLSTVRKAIGIPLTIKIRSGWEQIGSQALVLADIAANCGIDAITVHPRTASQGFGGRANWSLIRKVKQRVAIPVIGNGDIVQPEDAIRMLNETGCDAVMIGRAAIGNPWIFSQVKALMTGKPATMPTLYQRKEAMTAYLTATIRYFGEKQACLMMRSRLGWFVKGLPNSSRFRESIKHISTQQQALDLVFSYLASIESSR